MEPATPVRRPRGFKIALIVIAVLFLLFVAGIYFLPHFLPIGAIKNVANDQARNFGLHVDFDRLGFSWNGSVVLDGVAVNSLGADGQPGEPLVSVAEVRTNVSLPALLKGGIIVNSVTIDGVRAHLRRNPDGSLNIPDFAAAGQEVVADAAIEAAQPGPALEPGDLAPENVSLPKILASLELHRLEINDAILSLDDQASGMQANVGLDFFHLEGGGINDPVVFSGRILPYPETPDRGDLPFTGRAAMVRNYALDLDGEATIELTVNRLSLAELATMFGFADMLPAGEANGIVKAAYANRQGLLSLSDMRLNGATLGLGDQRIAIPETTAGLAAAFLPEPGTVNLTELSLSNGILDLLGRGVVEGVLGLAQGAMPAAALDFAGSADFVKATEFAKSLDIALPVELNGGASFTGKAALPRRTSPDAPLAPTLTLDLSDGAFAAVEPSTGIDARVTLKGIGLRAAAALAAPMQINATVALENVPARLVAPMLTTAPVNTSLNGGIAFASSGETSAVELRLQDTRAAIPATPWSEAVEVTVPETRITYDLVRDLATIQNLRFTAGNGIQGGISQGAVSGIMAGNPTGQAVMDCAALLETLKAVAAPAIPKEVQKLAGQLRAATRIKMAGNVVEAAVNAEIDNPALTLDLGEGAAQAALAGNKTTAAVVVGMSLDNPNALNLNSLTAQFDGATVRYADRQGASVDGRLGAGQAQAAGAVDLAALSGRFTSLQGAVAGINVVMSQGGEQSAGVQSGVMRLGGASAEAPLLVSAGGGDFTVPTLDMSVENLIFHRMNAGQREESNFGNLAARLAATGYIGNEKPQIISVTTASLSATPLVINSEAKVDLGTNAFAARYAARVNPAGLTSLFTYLNLPPAMLAELTASGAVSYDGTTFETMGQTQGQLRVTSGDLNPFAAVHNLAASFDAQERALTVAINQLEGKVSSASGEAVASLIAQKSELYLSRAGSRGGVDIRVNGAAGPTRMLALGLVGMVPQLRDVGNTLHSAQVDGNYTAWIMLNNNEQGALALNTGGIWQNARAVLDGQPFLNEGGKLSAALEGEFAYRDNQVRISRLLLSSESANMNAEGAVQVQLATGSDNAIAGVDTVSTTMRFGAPDLTRVAQVFPGILPADLGLTGHVVGAFQASGAASNIQVQQASVQFQNFTAALGSIPLAIPRGEATFNGNLALNLGAPSTGSPYDALRLVNIANGTAALTGAQLKDKPIDRMDAAFQLQNGLLALQSAQVSIGGGAGGSVVASGNVDFTVPAPGVDIQLAARNIPLAEANSEIRNLMQFESGVVNLPAQGQSARVAFTGLSEDEILRTLRLENFNFATGAVALLTGPALNQELDRARGLMRQEVSESGKARRITFQTITGALNAAGDGVINIDQSNPVNVVGDNTGDFRIRGAIYANHTMDITAMIVGKLENLIGFSLPNLIPNLRSGSESDRNRFMERLNQSAAKENYAIHITGPLDNPDLSGIGQIVAQLLKDIFLAAPTQIIGGVVDLGKDAPGALLDAAGAILSAPGEALRNPENIPENILRAPQNIGRGIGRAFGLGRDDNSGESGGEQQEESGRQRGGLLPFLRR